MAQQMADKLRKVNHSIYLGGGYSSYMVDLQAFRLFNTVPWQYPINVRTFFKVPATAITDTYQKYEELQWQAQKYFRDNLNNMRTAVLTLLE